MAIERCELNEVRYNFSSAASDVTVEIFIKMFQIKLWAEAQ